MAIGSSKIGVLGGKAIVPGGSQTFNSPGTFPVPVGVTKVNITGLGGAGNAGNPGSGTGESGGGGGGGGGGFGLAYDPCNGGSSVAPGSFGGFGGGATPTRANRGDGGNRFCGPPNGNPGGAGNSGSAATAGNPGNVGTSSTGLGQTFSGGNAGNGGTAGNGGSAGNGGGGGPGIDPTNFTATPAATTAGGNGLYSGGAGQSGSKTPYGTFAGGRSGTGAGINGAGIPGCSPPISCQNLTPGGAPGVSSTGGGGSSYGPLQPGTPPTNPGFIPAYRASAGAGGSGGGGFTLIGPPQGSTKGTGGAGGGAGFTGNASGSGNPGSAGNPSTVNCVAVTPGSPYPISVGSPGGQINISWNPQ